MITEPHCQVTVGRMKLSVPIFKDVETTEAITTEIGARMDEIEEKTGVIDTQKNAIKAAYAYAVEKRILEAEHKEDMDDLARALERLASQLRELTKRFDLRLSTPPEK